jgi:oligopeptide/dipeptide ABC transporter ATP-binding protein
VKELMELVGLLPEQVRRYAHEFSGGQRQRICVARALALNPKLVIADEPVSALDVSIQAQILNLLVRLQRQFDLTYVFISHDLSVVRHLSDRVAVMYLGRIVELGTTQFLYHHPFHPYTEALLSALPIPNPLSNQEEILLEGDVPSPIHVPPGCSFHPRCRYKQEICKRQLPTMSEIQKNHWVACHFPIIEEKIPSIENKQ